MELYMYIQWKDVLKFYSNLGMLEWWVKVLRTMGHISTLQHTLGAISVWNTNTRSVAHYRFVTSGRIQYKALP